MAPTPRVFVTRQLPGEALARLCAHGPVVDAAALAEALASASHATRGRMASMAVDNLLAALAGKRPAHCVNPELFA